MRVGTYDVYAMVRVARMYDYGEEKSDNRGECDAHRDDRLRLVATEVVDAFCTCLVGLPGGCHHVCQLLQLVRLLQMTTIELCQWDPETVTGRACEWMLKHCKGGRDPAHNIFSRMRLPQMAKELRTLRDPNRQGVGSDDDEPAPTRGVVVGDRSQDFNPHPGGGVWLRQKTHFDEGITLSRRKWDCLRAFIDGERGGGRGQERAIDMNPPILSDVGSVVL